MCKAYDTAEFCRNVHACDVWKAAATQACITLGGDSERPCCVSHTHASLRSMLRGDNDDKPARPCLTGYVEKLNTHEGLYGLLVRSLDRYDAAAARGSTSSGVSAPPEQPLGRQEEHGCVLGYTEEAVRVGRSLRRDFEKAGIHLPEHQRDRLVELTGLERRLGIAIGSWPVSTRFPMDAQRHPLHVTHAAS